MSRSDSFRLQPPPALKEADVVEACCDLLALRGYKVIRQQVARAKTAAGNWLTIGELGMPDFIAMHGKFRSFLMEVKRPGGKLSPEQVFKIQQLQMGYRLAVAVVESSRELHDWLTQHERSP
jgi:hypothetical protein